MVDTPALLRSGATPTTLDLTIASRDGFCLSSAEPDPFSSCLVPIYLSLLYHEPKNKAKFHHLIFSR